MKLNNTLTLWALLAGAMSITEAGVTARPAREPRNPPAKTAGQSIN